MLKSRAANFTGSEWIFAASARHSSVGFPKKKKKESYVDHQILSKENTLITLVCAERNSISSLRNLGQGVWLHQWQPAPHTGHTHRGETWYHSVRKDSVHNPLMEDKPGIGVWNLTPQRTER